MNHKYGSDNNYSSGYEYDDGVDLTEVYVMQYRERIEAKGFIKYNSFAEIEPEYHVAIIHKPETGSPNVIAGKFLGIKEEFAQIMTRRKGLGKLISSTKVVNLPPENDSKFEIYAYSGSFDTWDSILLFLDNA